VNHYKQQPIESFIYRLTEPDSRSTNSIVDSSASSKTETIFSCSLSANNKKEHFCYWKLPRIAQAHYTMFITILCIIITHIITYIGARQMSYSILPISGKPKRFVSVELHSSCMKEVIRVWMKVYLTSPDSGCCKL
jgi:hypothetical protein